MIKIKSDLVKLDNLHPAIVRVLPIISSIYEIYGEDAVITSGNDGVHSPNSYHYKWRAIDLRTRFWSRKTAMKVAEMLKRALGSDFDIVLEVTPPHIHLEYDP